MRIAGIVVRFPGGRGEFPPNAEGFRPRPPWLSAYAEVLGTQPPTPVELVALLDLAGEAAHARARRLGA